MFMCLIFWHWWSEPCPQHYHWAMTGIPDFKLLIQFVNWLWNDLVFYFLINFVRLHFLNRYISISFLNLISFLPIYPPYHFFFFGCGLCTWWETIFWHSQVKRKKSILRREVLLVQWADCLMIRESLCSYLFLQPRERSRLRIYMLLCWLVGEKGGLMIHLRFGWGI